MKFVILVLAILLPSAAFAQPSECREIISGASSDDVAYRPGVDVRGKTVVPADINPPMLGEQHSVVVPISVEFANQLGFVDPNVGMEGVIGFVEVWPDGRVSYNGQDLTGRVETICDGPPPAADRQKDGDTIESEPVSPKGK